MPEQMSRQHQADESKIASIESGFGTFGGYGIVVFIIILVQIGLMIGLNVMQKSRAENARKEIATYQTQLNQPGYKTINEQIDDVLAGSSQLNAVLDSRVKWSTFHALLNAVTPKNVKVTGVSLSESGTFKADGVTDSLTSLAQLVVAWRDGTTTTPTPLNSVTLASNGSAVEGNIRKVSFSISAAINMGMIK